MTLVRARIEVPIPRKRRGTGADSHQKTLDKFFEQILQAILRRMCFLGINIFPIVCVRVCVC